MKKIYNNLNIENLMKTEWFNQFDEKQRGIIQEGLQANLNVSVYAKPEFDDNQMFQIRLGLLFNVDVSVYAKPELSWRKMEKIRYKLMKEKKKNE